MNFVIVMNIYVYIFSVMFNITGPEFSPQGSIHFLWIIQYSLCLFFKIFFLLNILSHFIIHCLAFIYYAYQLVNSVPQMYSYLQNHKPDIKF